MHKFLLLASFLLSGFYSIGGNPHAPSPTSVPFTIYTDPPVSPVRASAEWEEIDAIMVTWTGFTAILKEIVRYSQTETQVIIVCTDSNAVMSSLTSSGIPLTNVHYVIAPFDAIWCRDYGQWNVYTNDVDSLFLIDWIYNRPTRVRDDSVPVSIANYASLPLYRTIVPPTDLIHTGGNFMCDGFGTGFSSHLILDENPSKTEADIDTIMRQFMGINRYIKMQTLPYDVIHHIDMHIKLIDEETLLVGEYPANTADGPQIEANLQYILSNFNSVYGTPYKVVRIPMPPDAFGDYPNTNGDYRTYTNSVFVNNTIILPTYEPQYDSTAFRIYNEVLPGYNIVGINCNSIIPSLGAIHCITKEISAADPLLISHQQLRDTYVTTGTYTVNARIQHRSGITSAYIFYRTDTTSAYVPVPMTLTSVQNNTWSGDIPAQAVNSTVYYYIEAISNSGKTQTRPKPAPAAYWKFNVLLNVEIEEPTVNHLMLEKPFPNPSKGITCIPVSGNSSHCIIRLKDILGNEITKIYSGPVNASGKYFFNSTALSSGIYIIEMISENGMQSEKIVVR